MRTKLIISALAFALAGTSPAFADDKEREPVGPGSVAVDAILVRPVCFVASIIGTAVFVVSLPVAVTSKSVHRAAKALVVTPGQATFTRPLGDFKPIANFL